MWLFLEETWLTSAPKAKEATEGQVSEAALLLRQAGEHRGYFCQPGSYKENAYLNYEVFQRQACCAHICLQGMS